MKYDNKRHLKLLNYLLDSKKHNKSLRSEDPEASSELIQYQIILQDHLFWNNIKGFVLLIKNFVDDSLELKQFEIDFSLVWRQTMDEYDAVKLDLKRINNFHPIPRSYKFCSLITCTYRQFEEFEDGYCTEQEILQEIKSS